MRYPIAVAALFTLAAACADSTPSAPVSQSTLAPADRPTTLAGTIVANTGGAADLIQLATDAGDTVTLVGPMAEDASRDAGSSRIAVTGLFSAPNELYVSAYTVLAGDPGGCPVTRLAHAALFPACGLIGADRRR